MVAAIGRPSLQICSWWVFPLTSAVIPDADLDMVAASESTSAPTEHRVEELILYFPHAGTAYLGRTVMIERSLAVCDHFQPVDMRSLLGGSATLP